MQHKIRTDEEIFEDAKQRTYDSYCPLMNRKERRTAKGKLLITQAELAVARLELKRALTLAAGEIWDPTR